jgi:hypothetical protein
MNKKTNRSLRGIKIKSAIRAGGLNSIAIDHSIVVE